MTDNAQMKVSMVSVAKIKPYEKNPRINDSAVDAVAASINEFGFRVPLVIDKSGVIVCGHTRWKAAKKLGIKSVPCVTADDLTPEQIKAFRIADNQTASLADWEISMLDSEIKALEEMDFDIDLLGFKEGELEGILGRNEDFIERDGDEKSGASPWDRMSGESASGVLFSFGQIQSRVSQECYDVFLSKCPEKDISIWLERILANANIHS